MPAFTGVMEVVLPVVIVISIFASLFQLAAYPNALARWGSVVLVAIAADLTGYYFILTGVSPAASRLLQVLQAGSFLLLDLSYLVFVLYFTGHQKRLTGPVWLALAGLPGLAVGLMIVNWGALPIALSAPDFGFGMRIDIFHAPLLAHSWLVIGYSDFTGLFSLGLLVQRQLQRPTPQRLTLISLATGTTLILAAGTAEMLGFSPLPGVSLLQTVVALSVVPIILIVVTLKSVSVIPFSQQLFKDTMRDGYVILDAQNTVVDYNLAMHQILGEPLKLAAGAPLADLAPHLAAALKPGRPLGSESPPLLKQGAFIYEVMVYPLALPGRHAAGRMVVLHNVTDRDQMEATLRQNNLDLSRTNAFFASLATLTVSLQTAGGLDTVLDTLGQELRRLELKCFVALYQPDSDSNELVVQYISESVETIRTIERIAGRDVLSFHLDRKDFASLYGALETRQIHYFPDAASGRAMFLGNVPGWIMDPLIRSSAVSRNEPSMLVPLIAAENIIGLLGVWGAPLQPADVAPFRLFGSQLGWAIEKAMLQAGKKLRLEELAHTNALITALSKLSAELESSANNDAALDALGQALAKLNLSCAVVTLDNVKAVATVQYVAFESDILRRVEQLMGAKLVGYQIPKQYWPGEKAILEGVPVWYDNAEAIFHKLFPNLPLSVARRAVALFKGLRSGHLCFLPLRVQGDVVGVMPIWGQSITPADGAALSIFGDQVAAILKRNTSYQDEIHKSEDLSRLNSMVMALTGVAAQLDSTTNWRQVLDTLGQELRKVRLSCMVGTLDDAHQWLKVEHVTLPMDVGEIAHKLGVAWPGDIRIPRALWPTDKAITDKAPTWDSNSIGQFYRMFPYIPQELFNRTLRQSGLDLHEPICYLPMLSEEKVVGILSVWGAGLKPEDIPALSVFANQVATALKNAQLYAQAQTEIAERTQAEAQIRAALTEKEVLLKEVHHRVKNNLQIISSLLNLQMASLTDPAMVETLKESQNRVRSMALIHEKLYQSEDLASIDFSGYLRSLVYSLAQSYRVRSDQVSLRVQVDAIHLDLDTAIPCGLIVNELVSNSIKYAFPGDRQGQIEVACRQRPGPRYILSVSDDGVGLSPGFDSAKTGSLGMKLVTSLVTQIGGELKVVSSPGAKFEIEFRAGAGQD
jgi:two-component sensor histidine kinase